MHIDPFELESLTWPHLITRNSISSLNTALWSRLAHLLRWCFKTFIYDFQQGPSFCCLQFTSCRFCFGRLRFRWRWSCSWWNRSKSSPFSWWQHRVIFLFWFFYLYHKLLQCYGLYFLLLFDNFGRFKMENSYGLISAIFVQLNQALKKYAQLAFQIIQDFN